MVNVEKEQVKEMVNVEKEMSTYSARYFYLEDLFMRSL